MVKMPHKGAVYANVPIALKVMIDNYAARENKALNALVITGLEKVVQEHPEMLSELADTNSSLSRSIRRGYGAGMYGQVRDYAKNLLGNPRRLHSVK